MLLMAGMSVYGTPSAWANPEPQQQGQAVTTITGTVLDENNEPIIGASVLQKGTRNAVATDAFGNFKIRVPEGTTLEVSYVGYKAVGIAAKQGMTVYMQPTTEMLNELVAIGYGSQKRANLTGAVATVDVARTMDSRPQTDVVKALQGSVPGLTITTGDGGLNTTSTIKLRGTGTLSNDQKSAPLIVVDGTPVDDISFINPDDIADISVLKDAASSSIYGTRAAFGVLLITTKNPSAKDKVSIKYTNNFAWSQATVLPSFASVPAQLRAMMEAQKRQGGEDNLFGMRFTDLLPYAEAWEKAYGGKRGYGEVRPFQSMDNPGDVYEDPVSGNTLSYANWDVAGIMFNNAAPSNKHNVSVEGVTGKTSYRMAFGYDSREGLMNYGTDRMRRYTVNANITTQLFDFLKAGIRFNWANKRYDYANNNFRGNYAYFWRWGSFFAPLGYRKADDGNYYNYLNIASREDAGRVNDSTNDTRLQAWLEATIIDGLSLRADFTYDVQNRFYTSSTQPLYCWNSWSPSVWHPEQVVKQDETDAAQGAGKSELWTVNVYGTYAKTFAKDHNLKVMLGGTAERYTDNFFDIYKNVLRNNDQPYLNLTTGGADGTEIGWNWQNPYLNHRATAGFFGRVNYDYKGIYLFEFNGRYDGSSRFPANDQWAFFPSGSLGYRFTEENYFKSLNINNIVSNGKIRASYGHIGNEAVGDYMFIPTISTATSNWLNSAGTAVSSLKTPALVSSTLTWERIITTDVGVDLGFFNNSLNLTFDWFQRETKDMLAPGNALPQVLGAASPLMNKGTLRTRGWELGISWNHSFGDWDVYANASIYDGVTKVVEYNNETKLLNEFYSGATYGDIWGFETERYFTENDFTKDAEGKTIYAPGIADQSGLQSGSFKFGPGDIKYADLDHSGTIDGGKGTADDHGDLKVIGNATPRYEYSFRLGGAWKGFDLDLFFQGVGKRDFWTTSAMVLPLARTWGGVDAIYENQMSYNKILYDDNNQIIGYQIDQDNRFPALFGGANATGNVSGIGRGTNNFYPQSRYLMNMAYLRFKTLTFGYTLPAEITKKALIERARIYFSADNLCLLYNGMKDYPIDPEIGSQWTTTAGSNNGTTGSQLYFGRTAPMMRSFSFGIQVTF